MKIDFNEEKHEYTVDGLKIPSVSEILAPLSAERYSDINPAMLKAAAEKGRLIHEACEAIDYETDLPELPLEAAGYIKAYRDFLRDYRPKWEMIERIIAYEPYISGRPPIYAGTVDRFGIIDKKPCVVDIKTYASLSTDSMIGASCQTILYRDAIENMLNIDEPINRYVLWLKKGGDYRFASLNSFDIERGFDSAAASWGLVELYMTIAECKKNKRRRKADGE